jgi:hypothetical protein
MADRYQSRAASASPAKTLKTKGLRSRLYPATSPAAPLSAFPGLGQTRHAARVRRRRLGEGGPRARRSIGRSSWRWREPGLGMLAVRDGDDTTSPRQFCRSVSEGNFRCLVFWTAFGRCRSARPAHCGSSSGNLRWHEMAQEDSNLQPDDFGEHAKRTPLFWASEKSPIRTTKEAIIAVPFRLRQKIKMVPIRPRGSSCWRR